MEAIVMAGGKGERMGGGEKPMALLNGKPLLDYVLKAVLGSHSIGRSYVAVSPNVPLTSMFVREYPDERVTPVMTPGQGYVEDTAYAVKSLGLFEPFLIVSSDLPLLTPEVIDLIVSEYVKCGGEAMVVIAGDAAVPAGINVVHGAHMDRAQEEFVLLLKNPALAVNVNYRKDLTLCAQLMATLRERERLP